eukprot:TRINITY_DN40263_c0_g1_i1.p1 TRINITY_DN40263_c0_g1~~TRINITY_DN40263_c0_g1_i1.p1  ORF type:complete len:449 (-),score=101.15 TRINITY_DN40263_c0_g1_i1:40-1386(-)
MESPLSTGKLPSPSFHESAMLCGLWLLVVFVGVHTMSAMRAILEPLLWAFFLMMGLIPLTDAVEDLLMLFYRSALNMLVLAKGYMVSAIFSSYRLANTQQGENLELEAGIGHLQVQESETDEEPQVTSGSIHTARRNGPARALAVLLVVAGFSGVISLFFLLAFNSIEQMKDHLHEYELGAKRISSDARSVLSMVSQKAPTDVLDHITQKGLESLGELLSALASSTVGNLTSSLAEVLMVLLYMVFWLCNPIDVQEQVALLFRRYIMLKTLASAGYALCVWMLLHKLGVDLAIVFGLITFLFNFVPEIGPFLAALFPLPVILMDGRLNQPWAVLGVAMAGQLALKFVFGNIVEVMLIESQQDMKMHPVVILFFVAFFGWIWGPTGMLLSVPLVAAAKGMLHVLPSTYRDPLLVLLEGDKWAPLRYKAWYEEKHIRGQRATHVAWGNGE